MQPSNSRYCSTKIKSEAGAQSCNRLHQYSPVTVESRSLLLLGRCSRQLRESCVGAIMAYARAERLFILEHYFASTSSAAIWLQEFSIATGLMMCVKRFTCCTAALYYVEAFYCRSVMSRSQVIDEVQFEFHVKRTSYFIDVNQN
jgi:hypothetical protein